MTMQVRDLLIYRGEKAPMEALPLNDYLNKMIKKPELKPLNSACRRGYFGTWQITNSRLYLVHLKINKIYNMSSGVGYVFPDEQIVFANWFSGQIRVKQGKLIKLNSSKVKAEDCQLVLDVEHGFITGGYVVNLTNRQVVALIPEQRMMERAVQNLINEVFIKKNKKDSYEHI